MTSHVLGQSILAIAISLILTACGEEQLRVGVSLGGTGQPDSFGGGTLPVNPSPSVDEDALAIRYVVWAPDAHTQECEGLDLDLYLVHPLTQQILPSGYAHDLQSSDFHIQNNLQLELHIQSMAEEIIEPVNICDINLNHKSTTSIQELSCKVGTMSDSAQPRQVLKLEYTLPLEIGTWEMSYEAHYTLNGTMRTCRVEAIPFVVDAL